MAKNKKTLSGKSAGIILILLFLLYLISPEGKSHIDKIKEEFSTALSPAISAVPDKLTIDFIDVGQGDSALITTPDGKHILIDTGTSEGGEAVRLHLETLGVLDIEYLILSHPHSDHIGGATKIFDRFDIKAVIMPDVAAASPSYSRLLDRITKEKKDIGCRVLRAVPGDKYTVGECSFEILAPISKYEESLNNASIVARLTYKNFSALFTGDAEIESEAEILSAGYDISSDILKVPHHGSTTSLSEKFLNSISPSLAIISCAEGNDYGHPHEEILALLEEKEVEYLVTKDCGTISLHSDGSSYVTSISK